MTRRTRTLLICSVIFLVAVSILLGISAANGANVFAADQRLMLGLSLLCGLYVSVRGGILLERFLYRRSQGAEKTKIGLPERMFWKGNHAINHRMEERRKRVEEAKAREAEKDGD